MYIKPCGIYLRGPHYVDTFNQSYGSVRLHLNERELHLYHVRLDNSFLFFSCNLTTLFVANGRFVLVSGTMPTLNSI